MLSQKGNQRRLREAGIFTAAAVFLSLVGPFDATSGMPIWVVFLYWFSLIALGSYSAEAAKEALSRAFPDLPLALQLLLLSVAAGIAVTAAVFAIETFAIGRRIPLSYAPNIFGFVMIISAAMTGIGYMADKSILAPPPVDAPEGAGPVETFLSRLPLKFRQAQLYAISSEDHYLRVHTSLGDELILMRLADAVRELEGGGGLQVHRSWWVARGAVAEARRGDGKATLTLVNGARVPVSRAYARALREAGWF